MCLDDSLSKDRAWIEIDVGNLKHNVKVINNRLPDGCKIMAVVKANAYGHGLCLIAEELSKVGVRDFAVATLAEAIALRRKKIKGNILILGYTDVKNANLIHKYNLTQTMIDYEYAKKINDYCDGFQIKAHIKVNTGMNRVGESYENVINLANIYNLKGINVTGIYTHLACADSDDKDDVEFTNLQINKFFSCVEELKKRVANVGKIHVQSSYGLLNYPNMKCDYVRTGLIMYGVSETKTVNDSLEIKPVLTLKARITSVKWINKDEYVSYGRTFKASAKTCIATVSIGYADGYPRCLSNKNVKVLVNGQLATVIGRICMDQLVIDVTNLDCISEGDEVILIGSQKEVSAEEIAFKANTITHEILSRLGARLTRIKK